MNKHLFNPMKRKCLLERIKNRINRSNQLGRYRYIGEWGEYVKQQQEKHTSRYNKLRFFWQQPLTLDPTYRSFSSNWIIIVGMVIVVLFIVDRLWRC